jgi:hypothetical protein
MGEMDVVTRREMKETERSELHMHMLPDLDHHPRYILFPSLLLLLLIQCYASGKHGRLPAWLYGALNQVLLPLPARSRRDVSTLRSKLFRTKTKRWWAIKLAAFKELVWAMSKRHANTLSIFNYIHLLHTTRNWEDPNIWVSDARES